MAAALSGKTALITGAGRGIGAACAKLFVAEGARVVIVSRTQSELDQVSREIDQAHGPGKVLSVAMDVSDEKSVMKLFDDTKAKFGPVDLLVNNAATFHRGEVEGISVKDWERVMAVNVTAPFLFSREAFKQMKGRGGAIVNMSSLGGISKTEKFPGLSSYVVSKFAVVGLTESLAVEGKPHGIRVNCVAPGAVDTLMLKQAAPFLKTKTTPEDIAQIILYLCDDKRSGSINGTVIDVQSNL